MQSPTRWNEARSDKHGSWILFLLSSSIHLPPALPPLPIIMRSLHVWPRCCAEQKERKTKEGRQTSRRSDDVPANEIRKERPLAAERCPDACPWSEDSLFVYLPPLLLPYFLPCLLKTRRLFWSYLPISSLWKKVLHRGRSQFPLTDLLANRENGVRFCVVCEGENRDHN